MRTALLASGLSLVHCATPTDARHIHERMMASMRPVAVPVAPPPPLDEDAPAGVLLERGMDSFGVDNFDDSSRAFQAAISTHRLNDAGRVLAYWHIFLSEHNLGNHQASTDALSSFVASAEEVISMREEVQFAVDATGDFVDRFDLHERLARGRALLSAAWAGQHRDFGRSQARPVPVRSGAEALYFLDAVTPCDQGTRSFDRRALTFGAASAATTERITVQCVDDGAFNADYYFDVRSAAEPSPQP